MSTKESSSFDPNNRNLCSDDLCLGLIDSSGHCNVCKKSLTGSASESKASDLSPLEESSFNVKDDADIEFDERQLCKNENCIGLIGLDHRCKICKTPA